MKRTALPLLLGCLFIVLLSATGVSKSELFTIKPATPKSVICFYSTDETGLTRIVKKQSIKGYVVKTMVACSSGRYVVVMEKY